jgi:hypothetical protein
MTNDPEGVALGLCLLALLGLLVLVAGVIEEVQRRKAQRYHIDRFDYPRCERRGSQAEFARRLRARAGQ